MAERSYQSRSDNRDGLNDNYVTLDEDLLITSHNKSTKAYTVIEETLKGKEFDIPEKYAWSDKDGHLGLIHGKFPVFISRPPFRLIFTVDSSAISCSTVFTQNQSIPTFA